MIIADSNDGNREKTILINLDTSMQTPLESTKNAYPPNPSLLVIMGMKVLSMESRHEDIEMPIFISEDFDHMF
jgi:hypothetical protein